MCTFFRKYNTLLILFFIGVTHITDVDAQNQPTAFLLKRFVTVISFDTLQEYSTLAAIHRNEEDGMNTPNVVIRFCTSDPLIESANRGVIKLETIKSVFEKYGFSDGGSYMTRSEACAMENEFVVPTEIWIIRDRKDIPPYDEIFSFKDLYSRPVGKSFQQFSGDSNYIQETKNLARLLRKENSYAVIYVPLTKSNPSRAKNQVSQIKRIFRKSKILESKYLIKVFRWRPELSTNPIRTKALYPKFYLVNSRND